MMARANESVCVEEQLESMDAVIAGIYKLVSELLSYPEDLNLSEIEQSAQDLTKSMDLRPGGDAGALILSFVQDLKSITPGEYIETLELAPKCPLYLGYWAFLNEGAESPQRRKFMSDLLDIYRRYGLSLGGKELPDFLPVMTEFLWISLDRGRNEDRVKVITKFVQPGLPLMISCLEKAGSPYAKLLRAIEGILLWDLQLEGGAA